MDGGELHRLGRRLLELSAQVTGEPGDLRLTPGEIAVLEDVIRHPASSVSETSERTGFAQSHVSVSVARLKARGLAETETDPADGRRTRVRAADSAVQAVTRRAARSIEDTLSRALEDPGQARRAAGLLQELAALLLPPGPRKGSQQAGTAAAGLTDRDRKGAAAQLRCPPAFRFDPDRDPGAAAEHLLDHRESGAPLGLGGITGDAHGAPPLSKG